MATAVRVYEVLEKGPNVKRLVKTSHPYRAEAHVMSGRCEVRIPSTVEVLDMLERGMVVEVPKAEPQFDLPEGDAKA